LYKNSPSTKEANFLDMKLTTVKTIRATLLALFCSCVAQPNSDNMFVFAQYTMPPDCGPSCISERGRQQEMSRIRGVAEYESRLNDNSQGMPPVIPIVILAAGVGFGIYLYKQK
jgi:hypothetical protein